MSQISFFQKPLNLAALFIIANLVINKLSALFYLQPENESALALNVLIWFAIEACKVLLIAWCISKLFKTRLADTFIKGTTYSYFYIMSLIAVLQIIPLTLYVLLDGNAALYTSRYLTSLLGSHDYIIAIQDSTLTLAQAMLSIFGVGIILVAIGALYFYIFLNIANKIASYFISSPEEVA